VSVDDEPYANGLGVSVTEHVGTAGSVHVMVTWPGAPAPPYLPPELGGIPPAPPLPTTTVTVCPAVNCPALYVFVEYPPEPPPPAE